MKQNSSKRSAKKIIFQWQGIHLGIKIQEAQMLLSLVTFNNNRFRQNNS